MCVVCVIEEKEGHNNNIPCVLNEYQDLSWWAQIEY
jgi:hypothetical protein